MNIFGIVVLFRLVARPPTLHQRPVMKAEGQIKLERLTLWRTFELDGLPLGILQNR